jgi:hypothetical protein
MNLLKMHGSRPEPAGPMTWWACQYRGFSASLAVFCALTSIVHAATLIQNFSAASNDRFANDPAFIGSGWDWSGVGRSSNNTWGTMITNSVFLSAAHYHPGVGNQMTFFPGNDPGAASVTRTVLSGQKIGTSDLWIGFLDSGLPASITSYEFVRGAVTEANFGLSGLFNLPAFLGGLTPTAVDYGAVSATRQTVGTNRLEGFAEDVELGSSISDALLTVQNMEGDAYYGFTRTGYEAHVQGGDSGSPLMIPYGGELILAGIAMGIGTADIDASPTSEAIRPLAAFTYTGSYTDEIVTLVPELSAVPEPTSALATALVLAGGLLLRHRVVGPFSLSPQEYT